MATERQNLDYFNLKCPYPSGSTLRDNDLKKVLTADYRTLERMRAEWEYYNEYERGSTDGTTLYTHNESDTSIPLGSLGMKGIQKKGLGYRVMKRTEGVLSYFGVYHTLREAVVRRDVVYKVSF